MGEGIRLWATADFGEGALRLMPKEVSLMESDMALALAGVAERREERMRSLVRPFPPADTG